MLIDHQKREALRAFFERLYVRAQSDKERAVTDKAAKIGQILGYLEIVHAQLRTYSTKRPLVCIDCGAGNAYLSFLVYYFYTELEKRSVVIHCLDTNTKLVDKARRRAHDLGFDHMHFHACDIAEYASTERTDMVYSLHACAEATDKTLHLGVRQDATCLLSVACCQHKDEWQLQNHLYAGLTKHRIFKDRIVYMVADALRALLLEMQGYKVDILEFASTRHTEKNAMLRACKGLIKDRKELQCEYEQMRDAFQITPTLEQYLDAD